MRFYSYNYLLEQIAKFDWWGAALTIFKNFKTLKANNYRQLAMVLAISIFALSLLILFYYLRRIDTEKPTILLKLLEFLKN